MKSNRLFGISLIALTFLFSASAVTAQVSSSYQSEEQAFRARQDEGARLHQTYGENSPQYQDWLRREKGGGVQQSQYPPNQSYSGYQPYQDRYFKKNRKKHHSKWYQDGNPNQTSNWNWDSHNWAEQKACLRSNWGRQNGSLSPLQQQQLDAQMRAQWLQYNSNKGNNNWAQTNSNWNQYSDPGFLDYIHSRSPGLLQQLRTQLGF